MKTHFQIPVPQDRIREFCRKHGIRKMWLYGSALTGGFRPDSDVDVLVEFGEDARPGWKFFTLHEELEPIWNRKVDLYTPQDFRPSRRAEILSGAELVYDG
jgi:uncharacterized protein